MKITIDSQKLIDAINWASKTNGANDDTLVLEVTESGEAFLSHMGSDSYILAPLALTVAAEGDPLRIPLDGTHLNRITSGLKLIPGDVDMEITGTGTSQTLVIKSLQYKSTRFRVQVYSHKPTAAPTFEKLGEVSDAEYFESLKGIHNAAAHEDEANTSALRSVDLAFSDDKLVMMATNRWALAEITIDFTKDAEVDSSLLEDHFLLPRDVASSIAATRDATEQVEIIYDSKTKKFGYRFADGRVALFGLNSGTPIPYARTKDDASKDVDREATVGLVDLKAKIRTISSFPESDGTVHWALTPDLFEVQDKSGENSMQIDASIDLNGADSSKLVFIQSVLEVAIGVIRTQRVKLKWSENESHVLVVPVLDDGTDSSTVFAFAGATS